MSEEINSTNGSSVEMIAQEEHNIAILDVMAERILSIEHNVLSFAVSGAIEIGNILMEAKKIVKYGEWGDWCKNNLNYSQRKAERYMKIATNYGDENGSFLKSTDLSKVSISKALSLLALPDEEAETFVEEHDIEEMSVKEIDEEVRKLKEEKEKAESEAEAWKAMKEETEKALELNEQAMESLQNSITQLKAELRIKEEEQAPTVDTTEYEDKISKLEKKLQASKAKEERLRADIVSLQGETKEKIDAEVASVRESLYEQVKAENRAEIDRANEINAEMQTEIETLRKKLGNASNTAMVRFKIATDQLQDVLNEVDEELKERMIMALSKIIDIYK